jgi:chloramphenicol 3-O-phosphotransferase
MGDGRCFIPVNGARDPMIRVMASKRRGQSLRGNRSTTSSTKRRETWYSQLDHDRFQPSTAVLRVGASTAFDFDVDTSIESPTVFARAVRVQLSAGGGHQSRAIDAEP